MTCGGEFDGHVGFIMNVTKCSADKRADLHWLVLNGHDFGMARDALSGAKLIEMISNQATQ